MTSFCWVSGARRTLEDLGLEAAEIRVKDGGAEADASLRTSNPAVYAAGDVAFPEKYTHAAMATARLCVARHSAAGGSLLPHSPRANQGSPKTTPFGVTSQLL